MPSSHLLTFPNSTWVLMITYWARVSLFLSCTMSRWKSWKSPPLHHSHHSFSFGLSNHIHKLTDSKMSHSNHITNWKVVFRVYFEFFYMKLWRYSWFDELTYSVVFQSFETLLSSTNDQCIITVLFKCPLPNNLAPVKLYYSEWLVSSPLIENISDSNFISYGSTSSRRRILILPFFHFELHIDDFFRVHLPLHLSDIFLFLSLEIIYTEIIEPTRPFLLSLLYVLFSLRQSL